MTDEENIAHNWIYVIIPVNNPRTRLSTLTHPLFCAYCKQCSSYFSEFIPTGTNRVEPGNLPLFGCKPSNPEIMKLMGKYR